MSRCSRRLRPVLAVAFLLAFLPAAAIAVEIQSTGLRFPGLGEILSPLVDLVSLIWEKEGSGLDPSGAPRGDEGGGLDPDGAPTAAESEEGSGLDPSGAL